MSHFSSHVLHPHCDIRISSLCFQFLVKPPIISCKSEGSSLLFPSTPFKHTWV
jgi:hypothetical protein